MILTGIRGGHMISDRGGRDFLGIKLFQKLGTNFKKKGNKTQEKRKQNSRKMNKTQEK